MSFDKAKKLLSCPQVILELRILFGASKTPLSLCAFTVLHVSLEDTETRDLAGRVGQRDITVFSSNESFTFK